LTSLGVLGVLGVAIYVAIRVRGYRSFLLADSFYLGLVLYFLGSWHGSSSSGESGATVLMIAVGALWSGTLASSLLLSATASSAGNSNMQFEFAPRRYPWRVAIAVIGLVLFNLGFAYVVYSNLFGGTIQNLSVEGGLLVVRKQIASGEQGYFFPGLVKQVRDIGGPALVFYLLLSPVYRRNRAVLFIVVATTLIAMYFGGQRLPFLVMALVAFLGWREGERRNPQNSRWKLRRTGIFILGLAVVAAMGLINQLLGRAGADQSLTDLLFNSTISLVGRSTAVVPLGNMEVFDFLAARQYGVGQLWADSLAGLVPGTDPGLDNELHEYLGGSSAGNAPLGFPVSVYFNFGLAGVMLAPIAIYATLLFLDRWSKATHSALAYSARCVMIVYLPICYDPAGFLLYGGLVFITVLVLTSKVRVAPREDRGDG
jgi:hypothetical protein